MMRKSEQASSNATIACSVREDRRAHESDASANHVVVRLETQTLRYPAHAGGLSLCRPRRTRPRWRSEQRGAVNSPSAGRARLEVRLGRVVLLRGLQDVQLERVQLDDGRERAGARGGFQREAALSASRRPAPAGGRALPAAEAPAREPPRT